MNQEISIDSMGLILRKLFRHLEKRSDMYGITALTIFVMYG